MRCFWRAPIQAHQLLVSLLLPTTRKRRGPPKNELHLGHAVAENHSLNQCVYFLQLGPLGRHLPIREAEVAVGQEQCLVYAQQRTSLSK